MINNELINFDFEDFKIIDDLLNVSGIGEALFEKIKEYITKEDLLDKPLILPRRLNVQSEFANWFGKEFNKLHVSFISNLGTNAGVMAIHGLGYPVSIEGAAKYWRADLLVQRRLYPEITASTVIAWRRNIPCSLAVNKFIEETNAFKA